MLTQDQLSELQLLFIHVYARGYDDAFQKRSYDPKETTMFERLNNILNPKITSEELNELLMETDLDVLDFSGLTGIPVKVVHGLLDGRVDLDLFQAELQKFKKYKRLSK